MAGRVHPVSKAGNNADAGAAEFARVRTRGREAVFGRFTRADNCDGGKGEAVEVAARIKKFRRVREIE